MFVRLIDWHTRPCRTQSDRREQDEASIIIYVCVCVFVFIAVFVIVFVVVIVLVFVCVSSYDFWLASIISFQNMYGYMGL